MEIIRKPVVWIGAAALVAAFFAATILMKKDEDATPKVAAEPNLFPFIKPLPETAQGTDIKAASKDANTSGSAESSQNQPIGTAQEQEKLDPLAAQMKFIATEESVRKMRAQGAGEDDIYRMRASALSAKTAARLAEMEFAEAAWKTRVDAYLAERGRLLNSNGNVSGTDQSEALQQLRNDRFTAEEQQRLMAYEPSVSPQFGPN